MNSSEHENNIGKKVISASFGEGVISEITEMNNEPFYIVLNQSNNMRHYVPINDSSAYRYLSDEKDFISILNKSLLELSYELSFESKKDRINYYKEQSKIQNLETVCQNIKTLHLIDDRGTLEEQIYQRLIENLSLEYSLIKGVEPQIATSFILKFIDDI